MGRMTLRIGLVVGIAALQWGCPDEGGGDGSEADAAVELAPDPADDPTAEAGPAGAVLVLHPTCPRGYAPFGEDRLVFDPGAYDEADWFCDALGDRWVRIADGAALGGRAHDCRIVRPAPAEAERLLCMPTGAPPDLVVVERYDGLAVGADVLDVAFAEGDGLCPLGYGPMTVEAARALDAATDGGVCALVGDAPARLAPVHDAVAAPGCTFERGRPAPTDRTLCVQLHRVEVGPVLMPDVGDRPAVYELEARSPDGAPLARVLVSLDGAPAGWSPQRMVWDGPDGVAAPWLPDGETPFDLVPIKRHDSDAELGLGPRHVAFGHEIGTAWKAVYGVDVPTYRVDGHADSGLKLTLGTLRFMGGVVEENTLPGLFDAETSPAPLRFVVNPADAPLVIIKSIYTDARRVDE